MKDIAPWITCRPELQILDCTIRDGGLVNNSQFTDDEVRAVYRACIASGMDYMEIGYKNSPAEFPREKYGPWRHCEEEDLRRVVGDHSPEATGLKLAVMMDAGGKCDWRDGLLPRKDSVISLIRVACYTHQISEAAEMLAHAHELGYECWLNIMAISTAKEREIDQTLLIARDTPAATVVVVDSFGSLIRPQVWALVRTYKKALHGTGKEVGIHAHNNMQLAYANTLEAIDQGCNRADVTLMGLGRGAGNCPAELLLLNSRNPKYKLRPVLEVIRDTILPLRQRYDWGPSIPYHLTGARNLHPRSAMAFRDGSTPDDYPAFFDQIQAEE